MNTAAVELGTAISALIIGAIGAVVAFRKAKPETDQIIVSAAKDVVVIQKGVLETQREQMEDQRRQMESLRRQMEDLESRLNGQLAAARQAREAAELALAQEVERNSHLASRVSALEAELERLKTGS